MNHSYLLFAKSLAESKMREAQRQAEAVRQISLAQEGRQSTWSLFRARAECRWLNVRYALHASPEPCQAPVR
jgi:hypothetical protein